MGALKGLRILDFSTLLPGPFATMNLADMGAEVLRVLAPNRADLVEDMEPHVDGTGKSAVSLQLHRGKKTVVIDLKTEAGRAEIQRLVMDYDIVIEQFRPGVMDKLGLGYESLSAINPRLIYCALTGYGSDGALVHKAGHDINYLSLSGLMGYSGRKDVGPVLTAMQIADMASGSSNVMVGVLAAVIHRMNTGEGQFIDISMTDGVAAFHAFVGAATLLTGENPQREGELLNGGSLYDFYETKEGKYVSFGGLEPKFFSAFCTGIGKPEWAADGVWGAPGRKDAVREIIKSKTRGEWVEIFSKLDACFEPVLDLDEALESQLFKDRELVVEVTLPNGTKARQLGSPYKFSRTKVLF